MLYREIIAVCSQILTQHINTLCGQNVELLNVLTVLSQAHSHFPQLSPHLCYFSHSYAFQGLTMPCALLMCSTTSKWWLTMVGRICVTLWCADGASRRQRLDVLSRQLYGTEFGANSLTLGTARKFFDGAFYMSIAQRVRGTALFSRHLKHTATLLVYRIPVRCKRWKMMSVVLWTFGHTLYLPPYFVIRR